MRFSLADEIARNQQAGGPTDAELLSAASERLRERLYRERPEIFNGDLTAAGARERFERAAAELLTTETGLTAAQREEVLANVLAAVFDLGPELGPLYRDPEVDEIRVDDWETVYVVRGETLHRVGVAFPSEEEAVLQFQKIARRLGKSLNSLNPYADLMLPDGTRIAVHIKPGTARQPVATIRKYQPETKPLHVEDLVANGTLTGEMTELLRHFVRGRLNILVAGEMRSGKTTTSRMLLEMIPVDPVRERLAIVEDIRETRPRHPHRLELQSVPRADETGVDLFTQVTRSLRHSVGRLLVGEILAGEAAAFINAAYSGATGSIATIHALSPFSEVVRRLRMLYRRSDPGADREEVEEMILDVLNIIVFQRVYPDGSKRISHVVEVRNPGDNRSGTPKRTDPFRVLYRYELRGLDPEGRPLGEHRRVNAVSPGLADLIFERSGIRLPERFLLPEPERELPGWDRRSESAVPKGG